MDAFIIITSIVLVVLLIGIPILEMVEQAGKKGKGK